MCKIDINYCLVCGSVVQQNKTGRTKEYCSDPCRDFNKFRSAMESALLKINSISTENKKEIRSTLFSITNILNSK